MNRSDAAYAMRVLLLRHGVAVDRDGSDGPADADRPLTKQGVRRTRDAACGLAAIVKAPERILSSPYLRALETAHIAADTFGTRRREIAESKALLPDAPPGRLVAELSHLDARRVLCVGHAPQLDRALAALVGAGRLGSITALEKAGAACIDVESWKPLRGRLLWIVTAKILARVRRPA